MWVATTWVMARSCRFERNDRVTSKAEGAPSEAKGAAEPKGTPRPGAGEPSPAPLLSVIVLGSMRWIALATVLINLFARAITPGLHGVAVGWDRFTNRAQQASEILTQFLGVTMLALALMLMIEVTRSRAPAHLRVLALLFGGVGCLVLFASAGAERAPMPLLIASCSASSTLAVLAGLDAIRQPAAGSLGAVALLAGLASSMRAMAVFLADRAALRPRSEGLDASRVFATIAFALTVMLLVVATGWLTSRAKKLVSPAVVIALSLGALATRQILVEVESPGPLYFLLKHGAERLLTRPVPFVPLPLELFVVIVTPLLAFAALLQRGQMPALLGGLALLLTVGASAEIPLNGIALIVASLAITLASRDARGVWMAIAAQERSRGA